MKSPSHPDLKGFKVLFNAVPFGYGPASKILALVSRIQGWGAECLFCGHGVALDFVAREGLIETVEVNLYEKGGPQQLEQLSAEFDYGLTCMEPLFARYASPRLPIGFVDSLMWMWDDSHFLQFPECLEMDHYFFQNTFSSSERVSEVGIRNPVPVEGILDLPPRLGGAQNRAVIHLGGVENIFVPLERTAYPFGIMRVIEKLISGPRWEHCDEILVVCGRRTSERLREEWGHLPVTFLSLRHDEFVRRYATSRIFLTTPGLTTLLEASALGVPFFLLPPQNYSQYLILRFLERAGYPLEIPSWERVNPDFQLPESCSEEQAVKTIAGFIENSFSMTRPVNLIADVISDQLSSERTSDLLEFQRQFIEGVGIHGVSQVCEVVHDYLTLRSTG